jgi:GGDEF domain-containing protein
MGKPIKRAKRETWSHRGPHKRVERELEGSLEEPWRLLRPAHAELARFAERMCRMIGTLPIGTREGPFPLTVSSGVASLGELPRREQQPALLLVLANARLHAAKRAGGNRVRAC